MIVCKNCGNQFTPALGRYQVFCGAACKRKHSSKWEKRQIALEKQRVGQLVVPGTRVMSQPWAAHRYAAGTVVGTTRSEDLYSYIRVRLDSGIVFDFPPEHVDILEGGGNHALNDRTQDLARGSAAV